MKKLLTILTVLLCFYAHGQNISIEHTRTEIKAVVENVNHENKNYMVTIFYQKRGRKLSHAQITCIETNDIYIVRSSKKKSDFLEELLLEANDSVCKQTGKRYTL